MMFTFTNDLEDPIYFMDPYNSSLPSPLSYFEFDHGSILQWDNTSQLPLVDEPISTSSKLVLSKGEIKGIVVEQDKLGTSSFNNGSNKKAVSKRRPSKGDRHSKIPTANGLRDRRMRLSLDVARQFFKLQDMLSYDKASKTVKWLLQQAKSAIEELNKGKKSPCEVATKSTASCTSEGEVVESAIDDHEIVNVLPKVETFKEKGMKKRKNESRPVAKQVRKKLREEARERARERTQKKKDDWRLSELGGLRNESADSQTQILEPCSDVVFEIEQQIDDEVTTFGTTLAVTTSWSSLMSLSYHQEDNSCQVNPIPECQQFHGTSRESYSHPNLGQSWYY